MRGLSWCVLAPTGMDQMLYCNRCNRSKSADQFVKAGGKIAKRCIECRQKTNAFMVGYKERPGVREQLRTNQAKHQKTDKRKATVARHKDSDRYRQTEAEYAERKRELHALDYERQRADPGLILEHAIRTKIGMMIKGKRQESATVAMRSEFKDKADLMEHLSSQFEPWMTFENFGKHESGKERRWNVGHRIARFHFDQNNEEDIRRCWLKKNLFPQCGRENIAAKVKFPGEEELLSMRECWPSAWNDILPSQSERHAMERRVFRMCGSWAW